WHHGHSLWLSSTALLHSTGSISPCAHEEVSRQLGARQIPCLSQRRCVSGFPSLAGVLAVQLLRSVRRGGLRSPLAQARLQSGAASGAVQGLRRRKDHQGGVPKTGAWLPLLSSFYSERCHSQGCLASYGFSARTENL